MHGGTEKTRERSGAGLAAAYGGRRTRGAVANEKARVIQAFSFATAPLARYARRSRATRPAPLRSLVSSVPPSTSVSPCFAFLRPLRALHGPSLPHSTSVIWLEISRSAATSVPWDPSHVYIAEYV